ncbi:MAG: peptidoglycan endopeptidase [Treponema sp.]|nr:peptidoglycan endopeptidase [Treponema sp.]
MKINFIIFLLINTQLLTAQTNHLITFSDPSRIWGSGIERVIEEAYRQCIRTKFIDGRVMNIRLPFAMNNDRDLMLERKIIIPGDGKGNPELLWPIIEDILKTDDFNDYIKALSSGREKAVIFDMLERTWTMSSDLFIVARLRTGSYSGLPHRPYILTSGRGAQDSDVYNYIYCVGSVGLDCSGFVWHVLSYAARQGGFDLGRALMPVLGVPRGADPSAYVGTAFFNSRNPQIIQLTDEIRNLRPLDIMLFRDVDGMIVHSAVIQSIDFTKGVLRYLQCNNVSLSHERGVHDSYIYFDPSNSSVSLKDPSLHWTQKRQAPFLGEDYVFEDDGERYRNRINGGGRVVRMRAMIPVIDRLNR